MRKRSLVDDVTYVYGWVRYVAALAWAMRRGRR